MKTVMLLGVALAIGLPAGAQSENNTSSRQGYVYSTSPGSVTYSNQGTYYSTSPARLTYQTGKSVYWAPQSTTSKNKNSALTWTSNGNRNHSVTFTPTYTWTAEGVYDDKTIAHLDIRNADIRHALRTVLEAAGRDFEITDKDLPDTRISLKADNVRLSTALDLITRSAGLSWRAEKQKDNKTIYKIGKAVSNSPYVTLDLTNANQNVLLDPTTNRIKATYPSTLNVDPNLTKIYNDNNLFKGSTSVTYPNVSELLVNPGSANFFTVNTSEERSTFTCPHCKGQATVIRHRQVPKCPKCSRDFQADWQFCPFDGSKRPAAAAAWRFCPICGKEVEPAKNERSSQLSVPVLGDLPVIGSLFRN